MNTIEYCRSYFSATGMHISLLKGGLAVYSSLGETLSMPLEGIWSIFPANRMPCFCGIAPGILYGIVMNEGTGEHVILGPALNIPLTDDVIDQLSNVLSISVERKDAFAEALSALPAMNGLSLAKHLSLVHLSLNGRTVDCGAIFAASGIPAPETVDMQSRVNSLENGILHNSYYFEVEMYQKVRDGNVERLIEFFRDNASTSLQEGVTASTPLRHAKNVFITVVSRTGFIGAIPGNMDRESAYRLMDYYIRECERLTTVEAVNNLQYEMVLDFCRRTGAAKRDASVSTDVWHCINYIRSHIYAQITLADLAQCVHRSASYVMKRFKAELGVHVSAYVTRCKLEEAQTMLIYTEKSLSQISSDLCFSSQSYFQNLFKRAFGITPARYRKRERTRTP